MTLLDENTRSDVQALLDDIADDVKMVMFTQEFECEYCSETREIAQEIAALSDRVNVEVLDFVDDKDLADQYGVDKIPALVLLGPDDQDYGVRYYGIPSGYEFSSLLHDLKAAANGPANTELTTETLDYLNQLQDPIHLQVFVTPTCPYCPRAVILAHSMAIASEKVQADMVEATEFPHLSMKYSVMGVPRTVINETEFVEGAVPEQMLIGQIKMALKA